jgi:hypothetical protein
MLPPVWVAGAGNVIPIGWVRVREIYERVESIFDEEK